MQENYDVLEEILKGKDNLLIQHVLPLMCSSDSIVRLTENSEPWQFSTCVLVVLSKPCISGGRAPAVRVRDPEEERAQPLPGDRPFEREGRLRRRVPDSGQVPPGHRLQIQHPLPAALRRGGKACGGRGVQGGRRDAGLHGRVRGQRDVLPEEAGGCAGSPGADALGLLPHRLPGAPAAAALPRGLQLEGGTRPGVRHQVQKDSPRDPPQGRAKLKTLRIRNRFTTKGYPQIVFFLRAILLSL
ncbi:hypothetical protein CEXT_216101 [Caerostris extrusa]|uniref:Uncharacterized protein n=1 Tax=Caerostris extrusa TaxID=172846 RepID=A0AAV4SYK8_CAEEX|nr:hypothetical protein CEXT_216101 [Caerostris extrusa]